MAHASRGRLSAALGAWILVGALAAPASAVQSPQIPLAPTVIPQFVQPLPTLATTGGTITAAYGNTALSIRMCEFQANVLPAGTPGVLTATWVWGYLIDDPAIPAVAALRCDDLIDAYDTVPGNGIKDPLDTYIGPVLVNERNGGSTDITWINDLGSAATTNVLAYKYSTDQTIHWADPLGLLCPMTLMEMPPAFGSPCAENYLGPVPAVPHLHGGEVPAEIDGSPEAWFTSDAAIHGSRYYSFGATAGNAALYKYPNVQEAAPLWFHDHTLGLTRLNVYAGLAGAYYLRDSTLPLPTNLQPIEEVVPLVIQDRIFDTDGQLFYQADSAGNILWALNPEHPYWMPELIGDTIVVNGKAWPYLDVEPKRYRFLVLNGSNARTYGLSFSGMAGKSLGPVMWVIATDGGYLDTPVKIDPALGQTLIVMPGERYEVIVDFAGYAGGSLILRNNAKTPFPGGAAPSGRTLGRILKINVNLPLAATDTSYDPASGIALRPPMVRLADPAVGAPLVTAAVTRQLTLNEVMMMPITAVDPVTGLMTTYPGGPLDVLLNNTGWEGVFKGTPRADFTPVTANGNTLYLSEFPQEGTTEIWEIVNITADAHPIHLHLVQFQLINRQDINVRKYTALYDSLFPAVAGDPICTGGVFCPHYGPPLDYYTGNPRALGGNPDVTPFLRNGVRPPKPEEAGWKDTLVMLPGQVTRIAVRWAPTTPPAATPAADLFFPFDPSGFDAATNTPNFYNYVVHCHILDHEDNEMMRPDGVVANPLALRPLVKGTAY